MKGTEDLKIDNFLEAAFDKEPTDIEQWPLSFEQTVPYFGIELSLEVYDRINKLIKEGKSKEEIAELFITPTILRYFLGDNGIAGLKFAKNFSIRDISLTEIKEYTLFLFGCLETMVKSDPFCLDFKNLKLDKKEVEAIYNSNEWLDVQNEDIKTISFLNLDLFRLCWALYFNQYVCDGLEIHGPYNIEGKIMVIRDYFDLEPDKIWKTKTGYKKIRLTTLHNEGDFKFNYSNQPVGDGLNTGLVKTILTVDGKVVKNINEVKQISDKISQASKEITDTVNSLAPIDQVRKTSEIAFYMLRNLYEIFGENWRPNLIVEKNIEKFGESYIKSGKIKLENTTKEDWTRTFDPRIDFINN